MSKLNIVFIKYDSSGYIIFGIYQLAKHDTEHLRRNSEHRLVYLPGPQVQDSRLFINTISLRCPAPQRPIAVENALRP